MKRVTLPFRDAAGDLPGFNFMANFITQSIRAAMVMAVVWTMLEPSSFAQAQGGGNRPGRGARRDGDQPANRPVEPTPAATQSTTTANSFGTVSDSDRIRKWASDTVAKHDKDGNKILEGEELNNLGQSGRGADQNGDGKITGDELYQFSAAKAGGTSTPTSGAPISASATPTNASPATDTLKRKIINDKRKSYRFKSTKDRIDNWRYSSRDVNGDGQVSMSEFARTWNNRSAAEFQRNDKNNDGMITPAETK